ncbi:MAG TPA: type I phosphomannose isomerase catalytic subunit [Clostridia bacterium]|nr:type I phosphomannose isomerase catalytic subunit [Clostridia bacterium]
MINSFNLSDKKQKGKTMYPLLLKPVHKQIIWGGKRLITDFGFYSEHTNIAESWMLTCREDGVNKITNGKYKGMTVEELIFNGNTHFLGRKYKGDGFPLLIKLIDAKKDLSVQVHPDDDYAKRNENSKGKTEAWYILDCDEGAELMYGFNKKISKEEFKQSVTDNTLLQYVHRVKVKKGDFFYIPAGTLHAIGGGILLAEVQQNCNTTYRIYDYNRLENGKKRPLHIDKAVDVTTTKPAKGNEAINTVKQGNTVIKNLCDSEYFNIKAVDIDGIFNIEPNIDSFMSIIMLDGNGTVSSDGVTETINKGNSILILAESQNISLKGKLSVLISTQ